MQMVTTNDMSEVSVVGLKNIKLFVYPCFKILY